MLSEIRNEITNNKSPTEKMKTTNKEKEYQRMREAARRFLAVADELNELVSAYIDGSDDDGCEESYCIVREADAAFIRLYNAYYGDRVTPGLNYELAESVL